MTLTRDDLAKLYGDMWLIRLFEQRVSDQFAAGAIPGFVHLGLGQEACQAGICFNMIDGDTIGASHREHGVLLMRGLEPKYLMAELYGKKTGCSKGKGGSMHAGKLAAGVLGCNGILGPAQTIINGFSFAHKARNDGNIAVTVFGDGAANRGEFHEGMNFAAIWNLPTVYIINNNGYAISVPFEKQNLMEDLSARATSYGMPGMSADGNDIITVVETVHEAFERARSGGGPSLIELKTYRHHGHFEGDPATYRPKEEVDAWMAKDPIKRFHNLLLERGEFTEKELDDIKASMLAVVDEAQKFAEESPWPTEEDMLSDVFYSVEEGGVY